MHYNPAIHNRRSIRLKGYDYAQAGLYFITICLQDRQCRFGQIDNHAMILNEYGIIAHLQWIKLAERFENVELDVFQIMPNHMHGIIALNVGNTATVRAGFTPALHIHERPAPNIHEHPIQNTHEPPHPTIQQSPHWEQPQRVTHESPHSGELPRIIHPSHWEQLQHIAQPSYPGQSQRMDQQSYLGQPHQGQPQGIAQPSYPEQPQRIDQPLYAGQPQGIAQPLYPGQPQGIAPTGVPVGDIVGSYKSLVANACLKIYKSKNETMGQLWQRNYYEHIIRDEKSYQTISQYIIDNPAKWQADKFYCS